MTRATRSLLTLAVLGVMFLTGTAVAAAASRPASRGSGVQPGANCGNTSSAINQYCENIPTASGGSAPPGSPGSPAPALGTTLPQTAVRTYKHLPTATRKRARKLLSLPAPAASVPVSGSLPHETPWSLPIGVILALVAIAAAGATAVIVGRRRRTA